MNRYLILSTLILTIPAFAQDTASLKKTNTNPTSYMRYLAAFGIGATRGVANNIGTHYTAETRIGQSEFYKDTRPLRFVTFFAVHAINARNRSTHLPDKLDLWALGAGEVVGDIAYNYINPGQVKFSLVINENLLLAAGATLLRPIINAYKEFQKERTHQE